MNKNLKSRVFDTFLGIPGCGGVLANGTGTFASPGHPDTYDSNIECDWVIRTHRDEKIRLHFDSFALESSYSGCSYDYVEVKKIWNSLGVGDGLQR
jgi:hypothetical protein